jgi:hypothetical protein
MRRRTGVLEPPEGRGQGGKVGAAAVDGSGFIGHRRAATSALVRPVRSNPGTTANPITKFLETHPGHQVSVRDRAGLVHPVEADVGCRNTVFHAAAQSAAHLVPALRRAGVTRFRIELVREEAANVATLVAGYRAVLRAERSPRSLWDELRASPAPPSSAARCACSADRKCRSHDARSSDESRNDSDEIAVVTGP